MSSRQAGPSRKASLAAAVGIFVGAAGAATGLLVAQNITDPRAGGAVYVAIVEALLVLGAAILLMFPIAGLAKGSVARGTAAFAYLLGFAASVVVLLISFDSVGLTTIFLVVPAISAAAFLVAMASGRRPK